MNAISPAHDYKPSNTIPRDLSKSLNCLERKTMTFKQYLAGIPAPLIVDKYPERSLEECTEFYLNTTQRELYFKKHKVWTFIARLLKKIWAYL